MLGAVRVPVEVVPFGWQATAQRLQDLGAKPERREFVTDNGNYILDCDFGFIAEPEVLAGALDHVTGVVEHGLFIGLATEVYVGTKSGVQVLLPNR
jgi:ribose 5-phosphate isomerase A